MDPSKQLNVQQFIDQQKPKTDNKQANVTFHQHVEELEKRFKKKKNEFMQSEMQHGLEKHSEGKKIDPNINPVYWKENFLYPFALDKPPVPAEKCVEDDGTLIDEEKFKFPLRHLEKNIDGVLEELQKPLTISVEEIKLDLEKIK